MRLTAFTKYGPMAASTRQRLLQYAPALEAAGVELDFRPLLDDGYVASLATGKRYDRRRIAAAYLRRLRDIAFEPLGDVVFVYAELLPWLPSALERLLLRRGRPIIYDIDDAFFHTYNRHRSALVRSILGRKFEPLLRSAAACICGNAYLRGYVSQYCSRTYVIPTVVDTDGYKPAPKAHEPLPVIGWIGSPTTWRYVRPLLPLLQELVSDGRARVKIVGAGAAASGDSFPGLEFVDWSEASEIEQVQSFDIGIMPLPDDDWARGKSGYKLIQYMACGAPVVASPVGVNAEMVHGDSNGFLASTPDQWRNALDRLVCDSALRHRMGQEGRRLAVRDYSLVAHGPRFVRIILDCVRSST
ncbi:glycosyltransferase family 4 protein [Sphingomonas segetis]|jgi:glycosyltransferase involved in cell wall biosynthesis|uniref:glycosyltransferase family 4 protein n=1 Tax=Sphingomonas segetis TaxID=1104779 RepID=UPI0012D33B45|nr:glycosyltransferase family 4 protein [Sphingomonas segetis]